MRVWGVVLAAAVVTVATAAAMPAFADDGWYRHERREWREHEWREHAWRERHWRERYYAPYVAAPRYYAPPPVYYDAPRYYR